VSVRRLLVILISAFLCACTADLVEESPPSAPSTPVPANNAQNQVTTGIQLRWKPARGDGATTVYDVYFGTEAYTGIIASGLEQPRCTVPYRLLRTTSYRWYVETFNSAGRVKSDVWTFTTGIGDNPDVPVNTWPANGSDQVLGTSS
jgi:hypothetical protein